MFAPVGDVGVARRLLTLITFVAILLVYVIMRISNSLGQCFVRGRERATQSKAAQSETAFLIPEGQNGLSGHDGFRT